MSKVSLSEVEATKVERGASAFVRRQLGAPAGSRALGCSHMELPPGKRSWPRHWHAANEEAIYVLEGEGALRLGDETVRLTAGDYVALLPGPEHAHQLMNDGDGPLRYLCFSTMVPTDIALYPDSGKVGLFGGSAPGGDKAARSVYAFLRADATVDYWEGEE